MTQGCRCLSPETPGAPPPIKLSCSLQSRHSAIILQTSIMLARVFPLLALLCQAQALLFSYLPGLSYFFPPAQSPALPQDRFFLPELEQLLGNQPYPHYSQPSHEDCFDERTEYGEVQFNTTTTQRCTYSLDRICYPRSKELCLEVPSTKCKLEAGYTCKNHEEYNSLRCDTTITKKATVKDCVQDRFESLKKMQKTVECKNVTKTNCDSKWIINEHGQKVFDKNENCRDYTWEECELVDKLVEEAMVPVYTCTDREETYLVPEVREEEVTSVHRECEATGGAVCEADTREECATVEWTDCEEVIRPHCETITLRIPFQEETKYHRCNVNKNPGHHHVKHPEKIKESDHVGEHNHHSEHVNEHHSHPEQTPESNIQPEQIHEHHSHPDQMNDYYSEEIPHLGPHPNTEYHPQPITGYHHQPIAYPDIPS